MVNALPGDLCKDKTARFQGETSGALLYHPKLNYGNQYKTLLPFDDWQHSQIFAAITRLAALAVFDCDNNLIYNTLFYFKI